MGRGEKGPGELRLWGDGGRWKGLACPESGGWERKPETTLRREKVQRTENGEGAFQTVRRSSRKYERRWAGVTDRRSLTKTRTGIFRAAKRGGVRTLLKNRKTWRKNVCGESTGKM